MYLKDAFYKIKKTPLTFEIQQVSKKNQIKSYGIKKFQGHISPN